MTKNTTQLLREAMHALDFKSGPAVLWDADRHVLGVVLAPRNDTEGRAIYDMLTAYMAFTVELLEARAKEHRV